MRTFSVYDCYTDKLVGVIKTNWTAEQIENDYAIQYTIADYFMHSETELYVEETPWIETDIVINNTIS